MFEPWKGSAEALIQGEIWRPQELRESPRLIALRVDTGADRRDEGAILRRKHNAIALFEELYFRDGKSGNEPIANQSLRPIDVHSTYLGYWL